MTKTLYCPLTNVHAKGGYTAKLFIGSEKTEANVILDTGSSTLVISNQCYSGVDDTALVPTPFAQDVTYGIGGWFGPTIKTNVQLAGEQETVLSQVHLAITMNQKQNSFLQADGILGLAYHALNKGYNLHEYLHAHDVSPAVTYPWTMTSEHTNQNISSFKQFLWKQPEHDITPYFTALEEHTEVANQFSLDTIRSSIHHAEPDLSAEQLELDTLNQGQLIFGQNTKADDKNYLWHDVAVEHDLYYNVTVQSLQVEGYQPLIAAPLEKQHLKLYCSNGIIDSGASYLVLTHELHQGLFQDLIKHNPDFAQLLLPFKEFKGKEVGIDSNKIDLSEWPTINFQLQGVDGNTVDIPCTPQQYWQMNAPQYGQACFKIIGQLPNWPNQTILGLPLLNHSRVVFDRSFEGNGRIRFGANSELSK